MTLVAPTFVVKGTKVMIQLQLEAVAVNGVAHDAGVNLSLVFPHCSCRLCDRHHLLANDGQGLEMPGAQIGTHIGTLGERVAGCNVK